MAAAALSRTMDNLSIRLVESDEIGTVGVGEATIPAIRLFNGLLGIDEDEFIRETRRTFKLGIQFHDWGRIGDVYMHAFGQIGRSLGMLSFPQYWLRGRAEGVAGRLGDYSLGETAARQNRFARLPRISNTGLDGIAYAFHFDAALYAAWSAQDRRTVAGVERTDEARSPASGGTAKTAMSKPSACWKMARRSAANSSSIARVFARC